MAPLSLDAGPHRPDSFSTSKLPVSAGENQITARIRRALSLTGHPALRHVRVRVDDGRVCLQGSVPSWFLKQVAQSAVLNVADVDALDNELVVR